METNNTPATEQDAVVTQPETEQLADRLKASGIDPAKLEELKRKLGAIRKSDEETHSGSEKPVDDAVAPASIDGGKPLNGTMVEWSEYDIDFSLLHLYKKATYRLTPEGPKWVAMVFDFLSVTREFNKHGKSVNAIDGSSVAEPLNLGEYLKDMVNGKDQWRIATLQPASNGQCGILLEREVPIILPDPKPLQKKEEVAAPSDPELQAVEDAGLAFMAETNLLDNAPEVRDDTEGEAKPSGLRAIERGSAEDEAIRAALEDGALAEAAPKPAVATALALNAQSTIPAPQGKGLQPPPVDNPIVNQPVPAAGYGAAADLLRALTDEDYRKTLPQE